MTHVLLTRANGSRIVVQTNPQRLKKTDAIVGAGLGVVGGAALFLILCKLNAFGICPSCP